MHSPSKTETSRAVRSIGDLYSATATNRDRVGVPISPLTQAFEPADHGIECRE